MLTSILVWAAKLTVGKQILGLVDSANSALTGYRSELIIALIVVVSALEHFGVIPAKTADPIITALIGSLPITLAEKVSNAVDMANKVVPPPAA